MCQIIEVFSVSTEFVHLERKKKVWLCNEATAIHESETTRSQQPNQAQNSADLLRLRARTQSFIEQASADQLRILLQQQQRESQQLRDLIHDKFSETNREQQAQEQERILFELREERLRLKQDIELLRGGLQ